MRNLSSRAIDELLLVWGRSQDELQMTLGLLEKKGAMPHTCIVSALEGSSLGEQYAALATACSIGERVRDSGGAALVILDDVSCMVRTFSQQATSV